MKTTDWQPETQLLSLERELGLLIRRKLPTMSTYGTSIWKFGICNGDSAAGTLGLNTLEQLSWRLREERQSCFREGAEFEFSGFATIGGGRFSFLGEALMDLATGAYFEFSVSTAALS